jgi:drug/metabolite transporter (DMT)-like permease
MTELDAVSADVISKKAATGTGATDARPSARRHERQFLIATSDGPRHPDAADTYSWFDLIPLCAAYILAAANDYWVINWFKQLGIDRVVVFLAIVQNCGWPINVLIYRREVQASGEPRVVTAAMYRSYLIMGILASFVSVSRAIGITALPAVLSVTCANSEVVFQTILSRILLNKKISNLQYFGVGLIIIGVVVSMYIPGVGFGDTSGGMEAGSLSTLGWTAGIIVSLASRFISSLNTVLAEKYLGLDVKSRIGAKECALATTLGPFLFIPFLLLVDREYLRWQAQLCPAILGKRLMILLLCLGLSMSKLVDRISKYGIVAGSSTIFFAGVDSVMKVVAGIGSFFFFQQSIAWPAVAGFVIIIVAIWVLYIDQNTKMQEAHDAASRLGRYEQISSGGDNVGSSTTIVESDSLDEVDYLQSARGDFEMTDTKIIPTNS